MSDVLTAGGLLAGGSMTYEVEIPEDILHPKSSKGKSPSKEQNKETGRKVVLSPLTIGQIALIIKASKNDRGMLPQLMIHESLKEPKLSLEQIKRMHFGLVNFLVSEINRISGMVASENF